MKFIFFISILSLSISPYFAQKKQGKAVEISGIIKEAKGKYIYMNTFKNNQMVVLDSSLIDKKGKYKLNIATKDPKEFYSISLNEKNYALLILDSSTTSNKVIFNADSAIITKDYTVEGSKESKDILDFTTIVNVFQTKLNDLKVNYNTPDSMESGQRIQQKLYQEFVEQRNNFVTTNPQSLALLITTSYFNPQAELDWYKKIEQGLSQSVPNSNYHLAIKAQIEQIEEASKPKPTAPVQPQEDVNIGKQFIELNFKNPEGKEISMQSLKGNYVLVDFWASWCRPCRMENPNVVNLYKKYKEKGFTVYSISLDTDKKRWENAIIEDNLSWPNHVSDLQGWRTEAVSTYQFRGIPYTMLVDKEGKIIATNLRGPQLEETLKSIFGF